jgi:transcriptional regulator with XRE-family HTH domain
LKLAEQCDSSQTYIAEIEVGKKFPSLDMIERIAAALDVESYYLFRNKPVQPDTKEKRFTPLQRKEIAGKIHNAVTKIIGQY